MTEQLNEQYPGIEMVNGFYTPFYMQEFFPGNVADAAFRWKGLPAAEQPASRIRDLQQRYVQIINGDSDLFTGAEFVDVMLDSLGYDGLRPMMLHDDMRNKDIPLRGQLNNEQDEPVVQVLVSLNDDSDIGILESPVSNIGEGDANTVTDGENDAPTCEECVRMLLADFDRAPRWILVLGLRQAALVDRRKWANKQCVLFDFDAIYSRRQRHVFAAMAVLLHATSLNPTDGESVLDTFDEHSAKQSVAVSENLKSALRECVELLGNETIHYWTAAAPEDERKNIDDINADDLTVQALRYMYRLLFLLFMEAKPELGYAPMKSSAYRTAYSLDGLRDIAEAVRGHIDEVGDSTYVADTLNQLDDMIYNGYPSEANRQKHFANAEQLDNAFVIPPLKAHIFDPERTSMITGAKLRDTVMLKIVDLMSVTKAGGSGKKGRRERISYAALGINQMGAVYEALLSYRGFIAKELLYEVKRARDRFDPLNVGYFVPGRELDKYREDERVRYESGEHKGDLRTYEPGTFIYRLAGRERETSASFYTPDSLARCLVKYALKEIEPNIHEARDILKLTICEPAMGSATFLNETISQLAEWYLNLREKELVASEGIGAAIPAERRQAELQRVKMLIADRNIHAWT